MDKTTKTFAVTLADAIGRTNSLRKDIVKVINEDDVTMGDGIVALIAIAVANAKEHNLDHEEFVLMCSALYEWITATKDGNDVIDEFPTDKLSN